MMKHIYCEYRWKPVITFNSTIFYSIFVFQTFSNGEIGEERGPEVVAVEGEAVVDDGGGKPEVVDDQRLLSQIRSLEKLEKSEVAFAAAVMVMLVVVSMIRRVMLSNINYVKNPIDVCVDLIYIY